GNSPGTSQSSPPGGPTTPAKEPSASAQPAKNEQPSVASGDIGTTSDEQLSEAVDVLRGLALVNGRTAAARCGARECAFWCSGPARSAGISACGWPRRAAP